MTSAAVVEMGARRQIAGDDAAHGVAQALAPRDAEATPGRCPGCGDGRCSWKGSGRAAHGSGLG